MNLIHKPIPILYEEADYVANKMPVLRNIDPNDIPDDIVPLIPLMYQHGYEEVDFGTGIKRQYVVTAKPGFNIEDIELEFELDTTANNQVDSNIIPDRPIEVANRLEASDRQTVYWLTYEEVLKLRQDQRFLVEQLPSTNPFIRVTPHAVSFSSYYNFERPRTSNAVQNYRNHALHICGNGMKDSYFLDGGYKSVTDTGEYYYTLGGKNVDIVIMDNGVITHHPEFLDPVTGQNRFQEIDWYVAANIAGTQSADYYTNFDTGGDSHGTHCASICAGRTFGWAPRANIYSMRIFGTNATDTNTAFSLIRGFHLNKPINPETGFKNPTIVNASWGTTTFMCECVGYNETADGSYFGQIKSTTAEPHSYRGATFTGTVMNESKGMNKLFLTGIGTYTSGRLFYQYSHHGNNGRSEWDTPSYPAAIQSMMDAGVHFIMSAGNEGQQIDNDDGIEYNNYAFTMAFTFIGYYFYLPYYYNRPCAPAVKNSNAMISVGSTESDTYLGAEYKAWYSNYGTHVDLYAPGSNVYSAGYAAGQIYKDPVTGQTDFSGNTYYYQPATGTSFACPQVCGFGALVLSAYPWYTPKMLKDFILNNCQIPNEVYNTNTSADYTNRKYTGVQGPRGFLFSPFSRRYETLVDRADNLQLDNLQIELQ